MTEKQKHVVHFSIVYFFVVLVFSIEVLALKVERIGDKIEQLFSIIMLLVYPMYYYLVLFTGAKAKERNFKTSEYYRWQFPDIKNKGKNFSILSIYFTLFIVVIIIVSLFTYRDNLAIFFTNIHEKIWEGVTYDIIIGIVIGIYAFLLAFFPIVVAYLNNSCIFFRPYDLSVIKWSNRITIISLVEIIIYILLNMYGSTVYCLGVFEFAWILLIGLEVILLVWAFFMPIRMEKKVLRKVEKLYCRRKIYVTPNKKWGKGDFIKQITDLLVYYEKILRKIKIDSIEDVEFNCILSPKKENKDLAKKRYALLVVIVFVVVMWMGVLLIFSLDVSHRKLYLIITLLAIMPLIYPLIDKDIILNNHVFINNICFISTWGYYIKFKGKNKRIYVTSDDYSSSIYRKYIASLKRIVCFYNLAINMNYEDIKYVDEVGINCLCDYIIDRYESEQYQKGMVVPILMCACLSYNNKHNNIKNVKEMLRHISIDQEERALTLKLCIQILRDIYGNDVQFYTNRFEDELLEMLK